MNDNIISERTVLALLKNEVFIDASSLEQYWNVLTQIVFSSFPFEHIQQHSIINNFLVLDPPTPYQMNVVLSLAKVCNIVSNWNQTSLQKVDTTPLQFILSYPELHKYRRLVSTSLEQGGNANINYALACMSLLDKDPDNNLLIELLIAEYNAILNPLHTIKEETDDELMKEFMNCKKPSIDDKKPQQPQQPQLVPKKIIRPKPRPFVFSNKISNKKTQKV
jgi:hypothetical protein